MANETPNLDQHHLQRDGICIVKYRQNYYDISKFYKKHPGGVNTLKGLNNADMTARFMRAPPHSDEAMYLMNEYKIEAEQCEENHDGCTRNDGKITQTETEECEEQTDEINNNMELDESMEHLIDWSKPLLRQIPKISKHYDKWVHKPVDRPCRLFEAWYLDMLSKTPWWMIPIVWIPILTICLKDEILVSWNAGSTGTLAILTCYFMLGILFWTLLEYSIHRWLFHARINADTTAWLCLVHFMIHGIHHKMPFDGERLVFPPIIGLFVAGIVYPLLHAVCPWPRVLMGGAIFGYICYDMIHYYLHYGSPTNRLVYHMKRYHNQHHFAHQDKGYGISTPLWDCVFNTGIVLKQLKYKLSWK